MGNQVNNPAPIGNLADRTQSSLNTVLQFGVSASMMASSTKNVKVDSLEELNFHRDIFNFRLKNREFLTHCHGFQLENPGKNYTLENIGCRSQFLSMKITFHFQSISQQFQDLYQISIHQGMRVLSRCLKGFCLLYKKFGYFNPESKLIQKQGQQWRVWISQNMFVMGNKIKPRVNPAQVTIGRFFQKVVHLFDMLRDKQNPNFSYSDFIYGQQNNSCRPYLQLSQILQKISPTLHHHRDRGRQKVSLRKVSSCSNETARKVEPNTLVSFDQKTNDTTLYKNQREDNCFNSTDRFRRKEKSMTMNLAYQGDYNHESQNQPRRITQNSQDSSQFSENQVGNNNFKDAFMQSSSQLGINQGPVNKNKPMQIISEDWASKIPSIAQIAQKTNKYSEQTVDFLKEYLVNHSKGVSHKRSLTDIIKPDEIKKVKFCHSQQFDSQFFLNESYRQDLIVSALQIIQENNRYNAANIQENGKAQQKKSKRVNIDEQRKVELNSDTGGSVDVFERNQPPNECQVFKQASINKLTLLKTQKRLLKSLLGNKLSTLTSIKQIQVDVPIDEQILRDLNKLFANHKFAKSTKLTQ